MSNPIREQILGVVARMRVEKRAAGDGKDDSLGVRLGAMAVPQVMTTAYAYPSVMRHANMRMSLLPTITALNGDGAAAKAVESLTVKGVPLRKFLADQGIELFNDSKFTGSVGPMFMPGDKAGRQVLDNLMVDANKSRNGAVLLGFKPKASRSAIDGITAHELGHAVRSRRGLMRPGLYRASKGAAGLVGLIGSLRGSGGDASGKETAAWTAASALSALPMLHEELQASRMGSKLLGLRGLRRLSAFRGVPTYMAAAAAPGLTYVARKLIDRMRGKGGKK